MKRILLLAGMIVIVYSVGFAQNKAGRLDTSQHAQFYSCSMHPDVISYQPGKCPKCGMELSLSSKEQMKVSVSKNYNCPVHLSVTSHDPGKCPKCGRKMNLSSKEQMKAEVAKLYTCPMHPDVALDKDGVCPKCGKELVEKKNH
jgi:predicted RNA-binding Zn-ribbon protein involved in translation (DUF1610 family)